MISTRTHGILDYIIGVLLIAAPWLLGFANEGPATWVPVIIGAGTILYALLTNYEVGLIRTIPMRIHLGIDLVLGLILAVSPWIFAFSELVWIPHLVVGLLILASGVMTEKVSPTEPSHPRTIT